MKIVFSQRGRQGLTPSIDVSRIFTKITAAARHLNSSQSDEFSDGLIQTRQQSGGAKLLWRACSKYSYFFDYLWPGLVEVGPTANLELVPVSGPCLQKVDFFDISAAHTQPKLPVQLQNSQKSQYVLPGRCNGPPLNKIDLRNLHTK